MRPVFSAMFSHIWISAYVIVMPGKRSFPRCVRGCEWPPRRATRERSRSNFSTNQSTSAPLLAQSTFATSGFFCPALHGVLEENVHSVLDAVGRLPLRPRSVDTGGSLGGVAAAEGGLIQQRHPAAQFEHLVCGGHAAQAAADDNHLVCWKDRRHRASACRSAEKKGIKNSDADAAN